MAKVHVISTPERLGREDDDAVSIWGNATQMCKEAWFYVIMVNLVMGLVFIVMDVVYYDSCFLGPTPLTKTVPVTLFLIGVSQMSVSVILPLFMYFLKEDRVRVAFKGSLNRSTKKSATLFASLMVAMAVTVMMFFVILGIAFASHNSGCHYVLVLFTQITCSIYIVIFLVFVGFSLFKKKDMPPIGSHFSDDSVKEEYASNGVSPTPRDTFSASNPFADNLSEVHLSEGSYVEETKRRRVMEPMGEGNSADMMLLRYFCVVGGVVWLISTVPGIPILAMGATSYKRCSNYRNVPDWLIAQGTILLFSAGFLIGGWCIGRGRQTKKRLLLLIPAAVIIIFLLVWPVVGVAWSDQARTEMLTDPETKKEGCTRGFVTGVLITSAIYSIPIFVLGYIIFIFILSLCVGAITLIVLWSMYEESR